MDFVMVNGEIVRAGEANLTPLVWDNPHLIHRKIWFGFGGIPLWDENLLLLADELEILGAEIPDLFKNKRELFRITKRMLNKNKFFRSGYISFHLFIKNNKTDFAATCEALTEFDFPFSEQGLLLHFAGLKKESRNQYVQFAIFSELYWKAENKITNESRYHRSIFLTNEDKISDAGSSNIFLISGNSLITPSLETGCYNDLLRSIILEISEELKFNIIESDRITREDVLKTGELFLAGERNGLQWVMGVENKRYVRQQSVQIYHRLNAFLKEKVI